MTHGIGVTVRGVVALNGVIFRGDSKRSPEPSAARQGQASGKTGLALRFQRLTAAYRVQLELGASTCVHH